MLLGILFLGSLFFLPWRFTTGILIGGLMANINFHFLHRNLVRVLIASKGKGAIVSKSMLRMFIIGLIIFIVLFKNWANVFGLILGLSIVVINLFSLALIEAKGVVLNRR
ncbi:MAG: hypothetical protein AMJ45_04505 [Syntrophobacter sp. DG_60]|nr:MAG: hypothetical protein AMJ45_04505 [Syntrophobacter sp. DG_60]